MKSKNAPTKLLTIFLWVVSFVIYYYIHMSYISFLLGSVIFLENTYVTSLVYLIVIISGTILTYIIIETLILYFKYKRVSKVSMKLLKAVYLVILFIFLFLRGSIYFEVQYVWNPLELFNYGGTNISLLVLVANITMFIPIKFVLPKIKLLNFIAISIIIEIVQAIFRVGIFDVNDIILYLIGFGISYLLYNKFNFIEGVEFK